jgi:hypothetical protein
MEDIRRGVTFRCMLRAGHPVRVTLQGASNNYPDDIRIYDPADAAVARESFGITIEAEQPYRGATMVEGEDLNGDGWTDLRVMTNYGTGGRLFDVFRYAPLKRRFVQDSVLSGLGNIRRLVGRPCARMGGKTGGGEWSASDRCWRSGRWVLVGSWEQTSLGSGPDAGFLRTERRPRGGRMVVVRADTLSDENAELP